MYFWPLAPPSIISTPSRLIRSTEEREIAGETARPASLLSNHVWKICISCWMVNVNYNTFKWAWRSRDTKSASLRFVLLVAVLQIESGAGFSAARDVWETEIQMSQRKTHRDNWTKRFQFKKKWQKLIYGGFFCNEEAKRKEKHKPNRTGSWCKSSDASVNSLNKHFPPAQRESCRHFNGIRSCSQCLETTEPMRAAFA